MWLIIWFYCIYLFMICLNTLSVDKTIALSNGIAAEKKFQLKEWFLQHLLRTKVNKELHCTLLTQKGYNKLLQGIKHAKAANGKTTLHYNVCNWSWRCRKLLWKLLTIKFCNVVLIENSTGEMYCIYQYIPWKRW